jgi:uncharacterized membrane protein YgdD (TMEM256/DUF423 family)
MVRFALIAGSVYGLLAVILGAFGAHALAARLSAEMRGIWHTAETYQFYHALALLAVGLLARHGLAGPAMAIAAIAFALGILVFSGSLYVLALTGTRIWGAVTPIGGVLLIIGWLALLVAVARG